MRVQNPPKSASEEVRIWDLPRPVRNHPLLVFICLPFESRVQAWATDSAMSPISLFTVGSSEEVI